MTGLATAPRVIVVLGPYRSGTSLCARILNRLGVDFGPREAFVPPNRHNPSGYLERDDLNIANTRLIVSAGGSLSDPPSPETIAATGQLQLLDSVDLSWTSRSPLWGLKDPRLCHTLSAWIRAGRLRADALGIVQLIRDEEAVMKSARGHDSVLGYADHDEERLRNMIRRCREDAEWHAAHLGVPTFRLSYDELLRDPKQTTRSLAGFLDQPSRSRVWWASRAVGKRRHKLWGAARARLTALRDRMTITLGRWRQRFGGFSR